MMNKRIDIIIPCYNERANLSRLVSETKKHIAGLNYDFEFVFVDDGSTDNTYEQLLALSREHGNISIVTLSRNFGKESAILAGLAHCDADAAIVMDADLQHPPDIIPLLVGEWEQGAQVVDAVKRERQKEGLCHRTLCVAFYAIMKMLTGMNIRASSDYKLLDRRAVEILNRMPEKTRFFRGLTNWIGLSHSRVEFSVDDRSSGESKWSKLRLFQLSLDAIASYSSRPLHIISVLGVCTLILSIVLGVYTLYKKFFGGAVSGFTTVILIILFFSSIIMISMGILGLYISKIFDEVKNRPAFIGEKNSPPQGITEGKGEIPKRTGFE